jgi:hypothetical protein
LVCVEVAIDNISYLGYTVKKKQEHLAALVKELGGTLDNDNSEAVVVCKRRFYS